MKHVRKVKDSSLSNHRYFFILVSFYCLGFNNTAPSGLCLAGFFCTGGSYSPAQHEAQEGHYTWGGAAGPQQCPLGTFQPVGSSDIKLSDDEKSDDEKFFTPNARSTEGHARAWSARAADSATRRARLSRGRVPRDTTVLRVLPLPWPVLRSVCKCEDVSRVFQFMCRFLRFNAQLLNNPGLLL